MTSTQVHVRAAVRGGSNWGVPPDYRTSDERLEDHHSEGDTQLSEAETALRALLQSIGAEAAFEPLRREHVDVEALALMGEGVLREAGVALGPRKKLLNAGVCTRAHAGAPGQECREGGADWDLESESQVHELQRIAPVLVLHLKSGRVHSTNGDVAGILVHEEDVAFVILMRKVFFRCHFVRPSPFDCFACNDWNFFVALLRRRVLSAWQLVEVCRVRYPPSQLLALLLSRHILPLRRYIHNRQSSAKSLCLTCAPFSLHASAI